MSYMALYRKFRPTEFEDVKGQEHIVTTLKNQIKAERIGHAYLFCGTRGTGKTTIAKILAKAVNCENPKDGSPCNECAVCRAINQGNSMNVIEIDAASNNGVDNIREIVEEVQYSPTQGKYKVYIIDEVHMLSTGAFNALLKTLEEPPSYVIFILATTEAHKIPITILSRCQRYDFKRLTIDTIAGRLNELLEKEGIEAEEKAIRYIAKAADGAMRDGLSLLDQCIAFYLGEKLTYDKVLEVLGAVDTEVFGRLFRNIVQGEVIAAMELLEELVIAGRDLVQFIADFTWYLRNLLLIRTSEQALDIIDASTEQREQMKEEAALLDADTLIRYIRVMSELSNQLKYGTQKRIMIEVALIKLCQPSMETSMDSILDRIRQLEEQVKKGVVVQYGQPMQNNASESEVSSEPEEEKVYPKAIPEELEKVAENWELIRSKLSAGLRNMLSGARPSVGENNCLLIITRSDMEQAMIGTEEHIEEMKTVIRETIQREVEISTKYLNEEIESPHSYPDLTKVIKNIPIQYND